MQTTRSMFARLASVMAAIGFGLALVPGAALAHGDLESTIPEAGSNLKKPTDHIVINFTEPPAKASAVDVIDGCKDSIIGEVDFQDRVAHVFLTEGQPGKWKVSYEVVSAADGHKTDGSFALNVAGKADCSDEAKGGGGNGDGGGEDSDGVSSGPNAGDENDGDGSFPVVPVALGTVGLIALALVARRLSG